LVCFPRLTEMGTKSFWDMIDIARKESLSIRDWVMQMPPVGRVRCLEALMAEIEATPPPESLRHSVNMQETIDIMAEYRRILEVCCASSCCNCGKVVPGSFSPPLTR